MVSRAAKRRGTAAARPRVGDVITAVGPAGEARPPRVQKAALGAPRQRVERNTANNAELRANTQRILSVIHEYRPKNTAAAYEPKQEEFREFCRRKQYCDGDTVTEDKLLLFLVEEVANRPLKTKSRKVGDDVPLEDTRLAWRSVRCYITALRTSTVRKRRSV